MTEGVLLPAPHCQQLGAEPGLHGVAASQQPPESSESLCHRLDTSPVHLVGGLLPQDL